MTRATPTRVSRIPPQLSVDMRSRKRSHARSTESVGVNRVRPLRDISEPDFRSRYHIQDAPAETMTPRYSWPMMNREVHFTSASTSAIALQKKRPTAPIAYCQATAVRGAIRFETALMRRLPAASPKAARRPSPTPSLHVSAAEDEPERVVKATPAIPTRRPSPRRRDSVSPKNQTAKGATRSAWLLASTAGMVAPESLTLRNMPASPRVVLVKPSATSHGQELRGGKSRLVAAARASSTMAPIAALIAA